LNGIGPRIGPAFGSSPIRRKGKAQEQRTFGVRACGQTFGIDSLKGHFAKLSNPVSRGQDQPIPI
jgi:hypothetical protein